MGCDGLLNVFGLHAMTESALALGPIRLGTSWEVVVRGLSMITA
jgi:hypothetical protein